MFCVAVCVRVCVYLHIENGKDANLVSQHAFSPVLVHSPDYSQYLILDGEEMSETLHIHYKQHTLLERRMWLKRWLLLYHSLQAENVMWVHKQSEADINKTHFLLKVAGYRSEETIFNFPSALLVGMGDMD